MTTLHMVPVRRSTIDRARAMGGDRPAFHGMSLYRWRQVRDALLKARWDTARGEWFAAGSDENEASDIQDTDRFLSGWEQ